MPSTILSDNGVVSGTAGIKTSGSNDGQLALQTTTAGGATATGLTINNTQQVAFTAGSAASPAITPTGDDNTGIFFPAADTIAFAEGGVESMRIDSDGDVGIGTSSPVPNNAGSKTLQVDGGGNGVDIRLTNTGTGGTANNGSAVVLAGANLYLWNYENAFTAFGTNNTERARISAAGGFSVGTTADPGAGAIYATGNITAYYSDSRLKDVKGNITGALDKVASLNGVYYTNNDVAAQHGYTAQDLQVGLLAQQVEAVLPEVVKAAPFDLDENGNSKSGENYKTVQYERIIPLLVEAIKELRAEVKALKGE